MLGNAKEKRRFVLHFQRRLSVAVLAGVLLNLALYAAAVQIFNFLQWVKGYDVIYAALGLVPILAGTLLLGTLAARLTIRVGLRDALSIGLLLRIGRRSSRVGILTDVLVSDYTGPVPRKKEVLLPRQNRDSCRCADAQGMT